MLVLYMEWFNKTLNIHHSVQLGVCWLTLIPDCSRLSHKESNHLGGLAYPNLSTQPNNPSSNT